LTGEINYTALGIKIRDYREQTGLTQEKLAEICALSTSHIGHIERGTRIPSLSVVFKIAATFQINMDLLLSDSYKDKIPCDVENIIKSREKLKLKALLADTRAMIEEVEKRL
jgi:transcriptional regulator with XRE-family HTH domain